MLAKKVPDRYIVNEANIVNEIKKIANAGPMRWIVYHITNISL
jgi:hypothetical protein